MRYFADRLSVDQMRYAMSPVVSSDCRKATAKKVEIQACSFGSKMSVESGGCTV